MHHKVEGDDINGDDGLPGIVLQSASQKRLWKEKPGDPEYGGDALVDPSLDELHSLHQVQDPGSQWLQGWVGLATRN